MAPALTQQSPRPHHLPLGRLAPPPRANRRPGNSQRAAATGLNSIINRPSTGGASPPADSRYRCGTSPRPRWAAAPTRPALVPPASLTRAGSTGRCHTSRERGLHLLTWQKNRDPALGQSTWRRADKISLLPYPPPPPPPGATAIPYRPVLPLAASRRLGTLFFPLPWASWFCLPSLPGRSRHAASRWIWRECPPVLTTMIQTTPPPLFAVRRPPPRPPPRAVADATRLAETRPQRSWPTRRPTTFPSSKR